MAIIVPSDATGEPQMLSAPPSPRSVLGEPQTSDLSSVSSKKGATSENRSRRRVSFQDDQKNEVRLIRPLCLDPTLKADVWYTIQELMDMQHYVNEMLSRLQFSNPAFVEIMFGDTFRGLERLIAKHEACYDSHQQETRRQNERRKARHATVAASVLWENAYGRYRKPEEIGTSWSPLSMFNFGGDAHHRVIVHEYRQASKKAANDAIDLAMDDATFVHDFIFPSSTNTLAVGEVDDALRNVHTKLLHQHHHTTASADPSVRAAPVLVPSLSVMLEDTR